MAGSDAELLKLQCTYWHKRRVGLQLVKEKIMSVDFIVSSFVLAAIELRLISIFAKIQGLSYIAVLVVLAAFNAFSINVGADAASKRH